MLTLSFSTHLGNILRFPFLLGFVSSLVRTKTLLVLWLDFIIHILFHLLFIFTLIFWSYSICFLVIILSLMLEKTFGACLNEYMEIQMNEGEFNGWKVEMDLRPWLWVNGNKTEKEKISVLGVLPYGIIRLAFSFSSLFFHCQGLNLWPNTC